MDSVEGSYTVWGHWRRPKSTIKVHLLVLLTMAVVSTLLQHPWTRLHPPLLHIPVGPSLLSPLATALIKGLPNCPPALKPPTSCLSCLQDALLFSAVGHSDTRLLGRSSPCCKLSFKPSFTLDTRTKASRSKALLKVRVRIHLTITYLVSTQLILPLPVTPEPAADKSLSLVHS